jgi:hypothetical protein|tara:strand:+ start:370 stop:1650 length:1281 start_codon:yes stop_codon:yes gene_type:complete
MTINKGLLSVVENEPNFSNQALENAVNEIKAIDKDDGHQFILSQFLLDTAIHDNTVLTTSQKNDVLETLYAEQPHLHVGRYLNDAIRHSASIIDGSIIPGDPNILTGDQGQGSFLEILQNVQTIQALIPELYGVSASEKSRAVNDHLGTLNNIFTTTEDSSEPVFTRLKRIMQLIDTNSRTTGALNLAISNVAAGNLNLRTFLAGLVADSTDFQQSLDNMVTLAANKYATLNTRISEIAGDPTTDLVAIREQITTQVALENTNVSGIRDYVDTVSNNVIYTSLAGDKDMRKLLATVSQNADWRSYFNDYEANQSNLNPVYKTDTDSDKSALIDKVLQDSGLPDVTDSLDLEAVANKAKRDTRIDTTNFNNFTAEQIIDKSCDQLGITTANRTIIALSGTLLNNMNQHDRDTIARQLDLNQTTDTIS